MKDMVSSRIDRNDWTEKILWWGILVFSGSIIFSIAVVQTVVILLGIILAIHMVRVRPFSFIRTPFDHAYVAFVAARVLSIPFSISPEISLEGLTKEIIFYVIFFVITQGFPIRERNRLNTLLWVLISTALGAAMYGSAIFLLGDAERATSTVSGPVTLGMYLAAILAMVLTLGSRKEVFPVRWIWFLVVAILTLGVLCTMNRIHWGIVLIMMITVGIVRERKILILVIAGIIAAPLIPSVAERIAASTSSFSQLMNGRDIIWKGALDLLLDRPVLGFGLRTFPEIFPLFDEMIDKGVGSWHNDYLQVYMESGIVGLAAFLWLLGAVLLHGFRAWKQLPRSSYESSVLLALLASMGVFMLSGLVGGFVIDPLNSLLFRLLLGLLGLMIVSAAGWPGDPSVSEPGGRERSL